MGSLHRLKDGRVQSFPGPAKDAEVLPIAVEKEGVLCSLGRPDATNEVLRFEAGRFVPVLPGVTFRSANRVARDGQGRLWVADEAGVHRFGPGGHRVFDRKSGLPHENTTGLAVDDTGTAWVGTRAGLARIKDDRLTAYSVRHGLPTEAPTSILNDGLGNLWVGWDGGVFRVPVADLDAIAEGRTSTANVRVFHTADGLRSISLSWRISGASRGPDGRLWFATGRGIVSADPARARRSDAAPRVYVEEVRTDGELVPPDSGGHDTRRAKPPRDPLHRPQLPRPA